MVNGAPPWPLLRTGLDVCVSLVALAQAGAVPLTLPLCGSPVYFELGRIRQMANTLSVLVPITSLE